MPAVRSAMVSVEASTRNEIRQQRGAGAALAVLLAGLVAIFALFEVSLLTPLPLAAYLAAWGIGLALVAVVAVLSKGSRGRLLVGAVVFSAALALFQAVPWSPRKPFLAAFRTIAAGMSPAEVERIMAGYPVARGGASVWRFGHSPDDGRFNSDWGMVYFEGEKVARTEFLPD